MIRQYIISGGTGYRCLSGGSYATGPVYESTTALAGGSIQILPYPIDSAGMSLIGAYNAEAPHMYRLADGRYRLYVEFGLAGNNIGTGYIESLDSNATNWTPITDLIMTSTPVGTYGVPLVPQHGGMVYIHEPNLIGSIVSSAGLK